MRTTEAYLRYSDHNQDGGFSIEYQQTEIKDYCIRNGLELHKMHIDEAQTATKVAGREAFFHLIERVKDGTVGTIVVYKLSRMFRNALESQKFRKLFRKHNVKLLSVTQHIDEETSAGRLMTNVLSDIDQYSSETTSDHVKSSMREMARQGYYTGGVVAFGFTLAVVHTNGDKVRKKLVPYEPEAKIVREIYEMYADGVALSAISDYLLKKGAKKKSGLDFTDADISRLLSKPIYIGTNRFKTAGYDPIIVEDCFEKIVDPEIYERVQQRKANSKHTQKTYPRRHKGRPRRLHALTGFAVCAVCGKPYIGYTSGASKRRPSDIERKYYTCQQKARCVNKNIRKELIESEVLKAIQFNILNDQAINDLAEKVASINASLPKDVDEQIEALNKEKKQIEEQLQELVLMRLKKELSEDVLKITGAKLEKDLATIKNKVMGLIERKRAAVSPESVKEFLLSMMANVKNAAADQEIMRVLCEAFLDRVVVDLGKVTIFLKVPPHGNAAFNAENSPLFVPLYAEFEK